MGMSTSGIILVTGTLQGYELIHKSLSVSLVCLIVLFDCLILELSLLSPLPQANSIRKILLYPYLFAIIYFYNGFIVMYSLLFILLGIHSNYCTLQLRSPFTFLFVSVCTYLFVGRDLICHGTCVELREYLAGVSFLLLPYDC